MVASVVSCLLQGLEGRLVEVQADASPGKVVFSLVGLADTGVKEARERVRSAIRNSGLPFPTQRLTVNLAPAELRKEGGGFDLPNPLKGVLPVADQASPPGVPKPARRKAGLNR
jgi:magnesium chelatase family protein